MSENLVSENLVSENVVVGKFGVGKFVVGKSSGYHFKARLHEAVVVAATYSVQPKLVAGKLFLSYATDHSKHSQFFLSLFKDGSWSADCDRPASCNTTQCLPIQKFHLSIHLVCHETFLRLRKELYSNCPVANSH